MSNEHFCSVHSAQRKLSSKKYTLCILSNRRGFQMRINKNVAFAMNGRTDTFQGVKVKDTSYLNLLRISDK